MTLDPFSERTLSDRSLERRMREFNMKFTMITDRLWVGMFAAEFDEIERRLLGEVNPDGLITGHRRICMAQIGLPFPSLRKKATT